MHCRPSQRSLMMFRSKRSNPSLRRELSNAANANGTAAGDGGGTRTPASPVLIQRLIILHDGLIPLPPSSTQRRTKQRRNPSSMLSEDASLEEHGEFILYYFDLSLHLGGRRPVTPARESSRRTSIESDTSGHSLREEIPPADYATEEAVRFSGICRALRSLPLALQNEKHQNDSKGGICSSEVSETDVVHLKESTLVFVPLELGGDIIAIAQIPRAYTAEHTQIQSSRGFGADPSAIKEAIRHAHAAFSLLLGGGIHRRLLRTKHLESSKDWVFEIDDDGDKEEEGSALSDSVHSNTHLSVRDDSMWEVTDDEQVELVEKEPPSRKGPSQKSRRLQRLSSSFLHGSFNSNSSSFKVDDNNDTRKKLGFRVDNSFKIGDIPKEESFEHYRYGGMEELFTLRREYRKLSNRLKEGRPNLQRNRWGSNSNAEDLFNDIADDFGHNDYERRIKNLLNILPIMKLREDLVKFYDKQMRQMQGVCDVMRGGVGRCVVEMIPSPISRVFSSLAIDPVRGQHPPLAPPSFVCIAGSEFMKSLMQEDSPKSTGHQGRLFGMSLFFEDRLVLSEFLPSNENNNRNCIMPPEIPYLITQHFLSSQKTQNEKATKDKTTPNAGDASLSRWMSNLSMGAAKSTSVEEEKLSTSENGNKINASTDASPGYIDSPPSSDSLFLRKIKKHVWLPRVHLPCTLGFNTIGHKETETHVAMFRNSEISFLLFFEMPSSNGEEGALAHMAEELQPKAGKRRNGKNDAISNETKAFADWLMFLSNQLMEFCNTFSYHEADDDIAPIKEIDGNILFPGEPGMDIIYVDRDESSFVLLSQHDLSSNEFKRIVQKGDDATHTPNDAKPMFGLFGIGQKPKETSEPEMLSRRSEYASILDCRHKLAAYLPLDVMLAFDDMFNEVGCLSQRQNDGSNSTMDDEDTHANNGIGPTKSIELCTFLPQGWVYCRACGNVELYILLDTSKFVTINDVQKAVTRVRERIFNDKIR